jgi:hypothetical protein
VIDFVFYAVTFILGFLIGRDRAPVVPDDQQDEIDRLNKQVEYYKDLCKWHVKDKERLSKR